MGMRESTRELMSLLGMPATRPERGRTYQAAVPSRLDDESFSYWNVDINSMISQANPILRARVRNLTRNFPPFLRAINAQIAFVIGRGGRFESLALKEDGSPDENLRNMIEARFKAWAKAASTDGRMSMYQCQQMALRQRLEVGEFFCYFQPVKGNRLALRFIEPDYVADLGMDNLKPGADYVTRYGIKLDRYTGERISYCVRPYDYQTGLGIDMVEIPARDMLHGFVQMRPDQIRGVTPLAAGIILASTMYDYTEAELDAAKMAAKWLAFIEAPNPAEFQQMLGANKTDMGGHRIEEMENATLEYLAPGQKATFAASPNRVTDSFDRFVKYVLRMIGMTIGVPYEIISGDYEGINYSTSRMCRQDYVKLLESDREWMDHSFNFPVFREWLRYEAMRDPKAFPDYQANPWRYEDATWIPAGMPSPDPLKEWKADIDAANAGLISPQSVIFSRGDDPEKVLKDIAEWQRLIKELGIVLGSAPSTAMANSPSAIEGQDAGGIGG
jgi:lambda family phage portal protein